MGLWPPTADIQPVSLLWELVYSSKACEGLVSGVLDSGERCSKEPIGGDTISCPQTSGAWLRTSLATLAGAVSGGPSNLLS